MIEGFGKKSRKIANPTEAELQAIKLASDHGAVAISYRDEKRAANGVIRMRALLKQHGVVGFKVSHRGTHCVLWFASDFGYQYNHQIAEFISEKNLFVDGEVLKLANIYPSRNSLPEQTEDVLMEKLLRAQEALDKTNAQSMSNSQSSNKMEDKPNDKQSDETNKQ